MIRELKFRAWNSASGEMHNDFVIVSPKITSIGSAINAGIKDMQDNSPEWKIMQFTGLYDNTKWEDLTPEEQEYFLTNTGTAKTQYAWSGKEIYEGDIYVCTRIKGGTRHEYIPQEVQWDPSFCSFCINHQQAMKYVDGTEYEHKVIGNIYQNPELLEPTK